MHTDPAPAVPPATVRRTPLWMLMYHSAGDPSDDPYRVTVSPARLCRQLAWLRSRGLRGVGAQELLRARAEGRGAGLVALTFDDGYADFLDQALPLLRAYECTATVFVVAGLCGGTNEWDERGPRRPLLTDDGVRAVAEAGMEVGSHGLRHRALAEDVAPEVLRAEVRESRDRLRELTGRPPAGYCYPYGTVGPRAMAEVSAAGYEYACAIDPGPLTGVFALPRIHVGENDTAPRLLAKRLLHPVRRRPVAQAAVR